MCLVVAGDGPERTFLENRTQELGEKDRVLFLWSYSRAEAKFIFQNANAFVLASKVEPLVLFI